MAGLDLAFAGVDGFGALLFPRVPPRPPFARRDPITAMRRGRPGELARRGVDRLRFDDHREEPLPAPRGDRGEERIEPIGGQFTRRPLLDPPAAMPHRIHDHVVAGDLDAHRTRRRDRDETEALHQATGRGAVRCRWCARRIQPGTQEPGDLVHSGRAGRVDPAGGERLADHARELGVPLEPEARPVASAAAAGVECDGDQLVVTHDRVAGNERRVLHAGGGGVAGLTGGPVGVPVKRDGSGDVGPTDPGDVLTGGGDARVELRPTVQPEPHPRRVAGREPGPGDRMHDGQRPDRHVLHPTPRLVGMGHEGETGKP